MNILALLLGKANKLLKMPNGVLTAPPEEN
jgi:hypothetical protein